MAKVRCKQPLVPAILWPIGLAWYLDESSLLFRLLVASFDVEAEEELIIDPSLMLTVRLLSEPYEAKLRRQLG